MKEFKRENLAFSLCGLNCGLCPMQLGGYCPGCGGGAGNQPCATAKCSQQHGRVEYCCQCDEYPCKKYSVSEEYDSFITHRNRLKDFQRFQEMGAAAYRTEQEEKGEILRYLLQNYNDGRRKSFFCTAVNLLELRDVKLVMEKLAALPNPEAPSQKQRAAVQLFEALAAQRKIVLKLRKKPDKKK